MANTKVDWNLAQTAGTGVSGDVTQLKKQIATLTNTVDWAAASNAKIPKYVPPAKNKGALGFTALLNFPDTLRAMAMGSITGLYNFGKDLKPQWYGKADYIKNKAGQPFSYFSGWNALNPTMERPYMIDLFNAVAPEVTPKFNAAIDLFGGETGNKLATAIADSQQPGFLKGMATLGKMATTNLAPKDAKGLPYISAAKMVGSLIPGPIQSMMAFNNPVTRSITALTGDVAMDPWSYLDLGGIGGRLIQMGKRWGTGPITEVAATHLDDLARGLQTTYKMAAPDADMLVAKLAQIAEASPKEIPAHMAELSKYFASMGIATPIEIKSLARAAADSKNVDEFLQSGVNKYLKSTKVENLPQNLKPVSGSHFDNSIAEGIYGASSPDPTGNFTAAMKKEFNSYKENIGKGRKVLEWTTTEPSGGTMSHIISYDSKIVKQAMKENKITGTVDDFLKKVSYATNDTFQLKNFTALNKFKDTPFINTMGKLLDVPPEVQLASKLEDIKSGLIKVAKADTYVDLNSIDKTDLGNLIKEKGLKLSQDINGDSIIYKTDEAFRTWNNAITKGKQLDAETLMKYATPRNDWEKFYDIGKTDTIDNIGRRAARFAPNAEAEIHKGVNIVADLFGWDTIRDLHPKFRPYLASDITDVNKLFSSSTAGVYRAGKDEILISPMVKDITQTTFHELIHMIDSRGLIKIKDWETIAQAAAKSPALKEALDATLLVSEGSAGVARRKAMNNMTETLAYGSSDMWFKGKGYGDNPLNTVDRYWGPYSGKFDNLFSDLNTLPADTQVKDMFNYFDTVMQKTTKFQNEAQKVELLKNASMLNPSDVIKYGYSSPNEFFDMVRKVGSDELVAAGEINKIYKVIDDLAQNKQLFERNMVWLADWLPAPFRGKGIVPRPYFGTFERKIYTGAGEVIKVKIPMTFMTGIEVKLANKFPKFADFMSLVKHTFVPYASPFGVVDATQWEWFARRSRVLDSMIQYHINNVATEMKTGIMDFIQKNKITVEDQRVLMYTMQTGAITADDMKYITKKLSGINAMKDPAKINSVLKNLTEEFQLPDGVLSSIVSGFKSASDVASRQTIVRSLAAQMAELRFQEQISQVTPAMQTLAKKAREIYDKNFMNLVGADMNKIENYLQGYVSHIYRNKENIYNKAWDMGGKSAPMSVSYGGAKHRIIDTLEEAKRLGYDPVEEIGFALAYDTFKTRNAIERKRFLDDVTATLGRPIKGAGALQDGEAMFNYAFKGQTYAMPSEVAHSLNKYKEIFIQPDSSKQWLSFYDKMQSLWKGYVTATPGFIARNVLMGNTWAGYLEHGASYFSPETMKDGINIFFGGSGDILEANKLVKAISPINGFAYADIYEWAKKANLMKSGQAGYDLVGRMTMYDEFIRMMKGEPSILNRIDPLSDSNLFLKTFRDMNTAGEDISKLMAFSLELKRFRSDYVGAANQVKKFFFDYNELTDIERRWFRRVIPFYTWMRKNVPLQLEQMLAQPGKFKVFPLGRKYLEDLTAYGAPDEKYLPQYMKERYWMRTPFKDKFGNYLYFNPNFPPQDLAMLFSPKDMLSSLTPVLKSGIEVATNTNLYYGTPIKATDYSKSIAPEWMAALPAMDNMFGAVRGADDTSYIDPYLKYFIDQIPQARLLSRLFPQSTNQAAQNPALQGLASFGGIKMAPYRFQAEEKNALYNERDALQAYKRMIENTLGYDTQP